MHFLSYFSIIDDKLFNNKSTTSIRILKIINNKLILSIIEFQSCAGILHSTPVLVIVRKIVVVL